MLSKAGVLKSAAAPVLPSPEGKGEGRRSSAAIIAQRLGRPGIYLGAAIFQSASPLVTTVNVGPSDEELKEGVRRLAC